MTSPSVPERFEVIAEVASSDTEILLRAHDTVLDREVFLKCPGPGMGSAYKNRNLTDTVLREARALARVRHPAVIGLIDVEETPAGPLLVLEPVTGETLADRLVREGHLQPQEVVELGIVLAGALEAVHAAGVLHRGITVESVVLGTGGRASLTGFNFAKPHGGSGLITMASLGYKSKDRCELFPVHPAPEQFLGKRADLRCDLFSLAWVLFEALTGVAPFDGPSPMDWKTPKDATKLVPDVPRGLARALTTCLAPEATKRLDDAAALRSALEACRETVVPAGAPGTEARAPAKSKRSTVAAITAGALVLVAGVAYMASGGLGSGSTEAASPETSMERGLANLQADFAAEGELTNTYEKSYALLIGIGEAYEGTGFPSLPNAEADVEAVAEALSNSDSGFEWSIEKLMGEDASRAAVTDTLAALSAKTRRNDRVFVYFAGHGIPHSVSDESGFMIPADAKPDVRSSYVNFNEFKDFFREAKAKHILVAMDCCYGGRVTTTRAAGAREYKDRFLKAEAHVVLTSGRGNETVSDGVAGEHSPFTTALVEALGGGRHLTTTMLFAQIQTSFLDNGIGHTPLLQYVDGGGGEFVFFPGTEGAGPPASSTRARISSGTLPPRGLRFAGRSDKP